MGSGFYNFEERYKGKTHRMGAIFDMTGIFKTPNATSMDLDAVHRVDDVYVFVELKKKGTPFKASERYVYEDICEAFNMTGKHAYYIEAWYEDTDDDSPVNEADALVQRIYFDGDYAFKIKGTITVKDICRLIYNMHGMDVV